MGKVRVFQDLVRIDQLSGYLAPIMESMKVTHDSAFGRRCPTCGAKPGEKCELGTGQPRTYTHVNRPKFRPAKAAKVGASCWNVVSAPARPIIGMDV
jgi:hypothetical protein